MNNLVIVIIMMQQAKQRKNHFEDLVYCMICYCRPTKAAMCPLCSKIYCQPCVQLSLEGKGECPNCRRYIKGQLTDCSRFVNQLWEVVGGLLEAQEEGERCRQHGIVLNYFCETCEKAACCECKMFGEHQNHSFKSMEVIYKVKYDKVRDMLSQLKSEMGLREAAVNEIESHLIAIRNSTKTHIDELEEEGQRVKAALRNEGSNEPNLDQLLRDLENIQQLEAQIQEKQTEAHLNHCYKDQNDLARRVQECINRSKENQANRSTCLLQQAVPPLSRHQASIPNFSALLKSKEPIYLPTFAYEGSHWRLVLYPCGNTEPHTHISLFLELLTNPDGLNFYEYEVAITHPSKTSLVKHHSARFKEQECWGYSKFSSNSQVAQYLVDDQLVIQFGVRFTNYRDLHSRRATLLKTINTTLQEQTRLIDRSQVSETDSRNSIQLAPTSSNR